MAVFFLHEERKPDVLHLLPNSQEAQIIKNLLVTAFHKVSDPRFAVQVISQLIDYT